MAIQSRFKKPAAPASFATVVPFSGPRLLTLKQAAEYIGHSVDLVREMVVSRELPHILKGSGKERSHVLIDRLDLDNWVEKNKVRAA
jgi:excisionase family DNA binding protein